MFNHPDHHDHHGQVDHQPGGPHQESDRVNHQLIDGVPN